MTTRQQVDFANVASGQQVSNSVGVEGARRLGMWCPAVNSCQAFIQAAFDTTSANFVRALTVAGDADLALAIGPGSRFAFLEAIQAAAAIRVELSVATSSPASFAVVQKFD